VAGVFANQAATAIDVTRVERDVVRLVARGVAAAAGDSVEATTADALAAEVVRALDPEAAPSFWALVERLAALRAADPARVALVGDMLDAAIRHIAPGAVAAGERGTPHRRSWRDRAAESE
jgi:hypothetical protein